MVAIPATPRLPKLLSATTIALTFALLGVLIGANPRNSNPIGAALSRTPSRTSADSTVGWRIRKPTPARIAFERQLDALALSLDSLSLELERGSALTKRRAFHRARHAYMRAESLLELYSPTTAHALNGPLENDDSDAPPRPLGSPAGFQIVLSSLNSDAGLAGAEARVARDSARDVAVAMRDQVLHLRGQTRYLDIASLPVLESMRTEIARLTTLALAGFDLDDSHDAVREAAAAFDGMRAIAQREADAMSDSAIVANAGTAEREGSRGIGMAPPGATPVHEERVPREAWLRIAHELHAAARYLDAHPDFERLDRLAFITHSANPSALAVADARAPLLAHAYARRQVWRAKAATVFEPHALDASAFAPDFAPAATPELIALGARLFSDTRLSGAEDRSCATCHVPTRAFTDGRPRPLLITGTKAMARNTPTLLDVAYQPLYFADERALSLEDQIAIVLASRTEMGSSATIAAAHIAGDSSLTRQFTRALPARSTTGGALTPRNIRVALAAYLRSLESFDSRFDRAARGDSLALTAQERRGFTLFMGKARCGTCHFAPLFSGVIPPDFTTSEPEIIGVATRPTLHDAHLDPDSGRAGIDHLAEHLHAFKVPSLRNAAVTAPYMHNGAYSTLTQVMSFYEHGGGAGLGARLTNPTLPTSRLHLSAAETRAIIAFLGSLTDTISYRHAPPGSIAAR